MRGLSFALFTFVFLVVAAPARAQVDPSAALLLNGADEPPRDDAVESGRYKPRPRAAAPEPSARRRASVPSSSSEKPAASGEASVPVVIEIPAPAPRPSPPPAAAAPGVVATPEPLVYVAPTSRPPTAAATPAPASPSTPAPAPPSTASAGSMAGVGLPVEAPDPSQSYKTPAFAEDDRRVNLLELEIAPLFVYDDSASTYVQRRYNTAGTGLAAKARAWITPTFGLQASYAATFGGHVSDAVSGQTGVGADHEWTRIGMRNRQFFGNGARAPSMTLGLDWSEYVFDVPGSAALRQKLRTIGVSASLEADFPSGANYAWTFRLAVEPRARQDEVSTQNNARSGSNPETNVVEAGIGGRLAFDRSNEVFWRLTHRIEQSLFSGAATAPDFQTGQIPSNVSVMNSFTMFELGYSWGN